MSIQRARSDSSFRLRIYDRIQNTHNNVWIRHWKRRTFLGLGRLLPLFARQRGTSKPSSYLNEYTFFYCLMTRRIYYQNIQKRHTEAAVDVWGVRTSWRSEGTGGCCTIHCTSGIWRWICFKEVSNWESCSKCNSVFLGLPKSTQSHNCINISPSCVIAREHSRQTFLLRRLTIHGEEGCVVVDERWDIDLKDVYSKIFLDRRDSGYCVWE